ncbi:hypothetical protein TRIP_B260011 [uncultured Desulfatiglans sp.]|nr:hypothetical protein TRIP_B260011 [uncultured Desulfatiglans sp.]
MRGRSRFANIKKIKSLYGSDLVLAAEVSVRITVEMGKKEHLRMGTGLSAGPICMIAVKDPPWHGRGTGGWGGTVCSFAAGSWLGWETAHGGV